MDINETLASFQLDDTDAYRLAAILQGFQDNLNTKEAELQNKEAVLHNKDLTIQALTLELAHLRRIHYGVKNEALSGIQQDLFEDTWNEDIAEVTEHVEQLTPTVPKPKRNRAGRQPLPTHFAPH